MRDGNDFSTNKIIQAIDYKIPKCKIKSLEDDNKCSTLHILGYKTSTLYSKAEAWCQHAGDLFGLILIRLWSDTHQIMVWYSSDYGLVSMNTTSNTGWFQRRGIKRWAMQFNLQTNFEIRSCGGGGGGGGVVPCQNMQPINWLCSLLSHIWVRRNWI